MKQFSLIAMVGLLMTVTLCRISFGNEAPLVETKAITLSTVKMQEDDRGTDVSNIYTIVVEQVDKESSGPYNVMYFFDGVYREEFKDVMLPYSFTRNFKGQNDGQHEVRIDIETKDLRIVARQVTVINVSHVKANGKK